MVGPDIPFYVMASFARVIQGEIAVRASYGNKQKIPALQQGSF